MHPLFTSVSDGVVLLDGGLATEFERRGADLRDPLWSAKLLIEAPEMIRQVHLDYLHAGADVITSASYQASFEGFARRGLDRTRAAALMQLSVRLARAARDEFLASPESRTRARPLVAASVGCYGATLHDGSEYRGDYDLTVRQLIDWHRPRLEVLLESGADLLACETLPCLAEGEALTRLLEESPVPAWLSFSCADGERLCHGERFAEAAALAHGCPAIVAIGVNCTPPRFVEDLLASARAATAKPLLAYPNSGETWHAATHRWVKGEDAIEWAEAARRWHASGARLIGGCCRTTPGTIAELAGVFSGEAALAKPQAADLP